MLRITNLALAVLLSLFAAGSVQAANITFNPTPALFDVGAPIDVDIVVSGLLPTEDVSGFDLAITFDDSLVDITGYTLGDGLGMLDSNPIFTEVDDFSPGLTGPGTFELSAASLLLDLSFQADSFVLATLTLDPLNMGTSVLGISGVVLDGFGLDLDATFTDGQVSPVPLPGAAWLLLAGFGGVLGLKSRRKS